jgi:hypothetical protein
MRADSPLAPESNVSENTNAFALSRIQAEGWNAARKFILDDIDDARIAALNPYSGAAEKARWLAGFRGALEATGTK